MAIRKRVLFIPILLVVAVAGYFLIQHFASETGQEEGPLTVYGNVEIREVNLGFRVAGRIEEMLLDEGDPVESGQLMAVLDAEPYEIELTAMQARMASAAANLDRLESGFRKEEIAQATAQLEQRQASLNRTEKDLHRIRALTQSGSSTQQDLDRIFAAHEEAVAQVALAQANLDLVNAGYRKEDVAAARAQLEEAKSNVARTQLQIDDTRLLAPAGGTILVRVQERGTMVGAGQPVFTLSLQDRTWVRAYIPETRLGHIHPGMHAEVYTDSRPGKPYSGQIGFIASRAEFTPKNVETKELRSDLVFRFRVVLDDPDDQLRQGMPVTVQLTAED